MDEAVEICKLRLFLKLAAEVETADKIEPLPDIDFNIRSGNTLVGYVSLEQIQTAQKNKLTFDDDLKKIEQSANDIDGLFQKFRRQQTNDQTDFIPHLKKDLRNNLHKLRDQLNHYLASEYKIDPEKQKEFLTWQKSHQPFHWIVEFYGILHNGGFDVVIGNPPYVEYKDVIRQYEIKGFITENCGNLFTYVLEKSNHLTPHDSRIGMIIPISAFSTDRMIPLINELKTHALNCYIANFSWRPGKLFEGVNLQLATLLLQRGKSLTKTFSTKYILWDSITRQDLFSKIEYVIVEKKHLSGSISKIGIPIAAQILNKMLSQNNKILKDCLSKNSNNIIYYRRGGLYWKVFIDFETNSSEEKLLHIDKKINKYIIIAILSSNLWFWYFTLTSDCRHLGNRDIDSFPFDLSNTSQSILNDLMNLGKQYVKDLRFNATKIVRVYKKKTSVECLSFVVKKSKPIIDEIDRVLAQHYGFTDEELNFIINYDIKYRMGSEEE
jgi:hypothetical protein